MDFLPTRVSTFDDLISKKGIERGNTLLISGGCGVGKTIFSIQSMYNSALKGEKGVYITHGEGVSKIKRHMKSNFNWDIDELEDNGLMSIQKIDPFILAEDVTRILEKQKRCSSIDVALFEEHDETMTLFDSNEVSIPFTPDRIVLDSISALEAAFSNKEHYRIYMQALIDALNEHESVNYLISETEQDPNMYSTTGIIEFVVDGVIVMYNIRKGVLRRKALEILKLRCSDHIKELVSYMITDEGIKVLAGQPVF
jgi:KaiC/GvpD/RAD55 family RecA-like ATPase